jgi:cephalosporin-C deacetylase
MMNRIYRQFLLAAALTTIALAQREPIPQQLTFAPYHTSGTYGIGETVGWIVKPGPVTPTYSYSWTARRDNAEVVKEGKLDLSSGQDKIEVSGDQPEMIYVAIEPVAEGASTFTGGNTGRNNGLYALGAAVAPPQIPLATPRPADFDSFWSTKLAAQAKVPIHPVLTPAPADIPGVEMKAFELDALGSHAHGYLAKPDKPGKFPALILLQYAGVYALNAHSVAARAAEGWLVMDVDSHDKQPGEPTGNAPKNYAAVGNSDRETSYFLNMYLRDSRALDYLLTQPEWDGKTIVLMGTSMGGQQSLMLAGLRPDKISAVLVCVPAGADTNGNLHGRKAGYPNWPSDDPKVMNTARYFDPVNFASHIQAPVLAAIGYIDTISPPAGIWTALNQIPVPHEPLPMIESEHNNLTPEKEKNWDARSREVLGILLHGGKYVPRSISSGAVPDWALPGSAAHKQVAPPPDFHRPSRNFATPVGIFPGQSDVGAALVPGSASYDLGTRKYTINSAGYNIWYSRDEFRFLWKKMSGDVSLAADVTFPNAEGYGDRKAVLIIRQTLDDDSQEAMIGQHGAGMIHLAERRAAGANIQDMQYRFGGMLSKVSAKRIGIEKRGDSIAIFISVQGEPIHQFGPPVQLHFTGPFYVGIGFCSHLPDQSDTVVLSNVVLENAAGKVR